MVQELKYESPACTAVAYTKGLSEEQFRALRIGGIGGSDAGCIMGLSQYGSSFTVVADKLGMGESFDNKATRRGKRLEPVIRENTAGWAAEIDGVPVEVYEVYDSPWLYQSNPYPWMQANIDGLFRHPVHGLCVLEIKTADARLGEDWEDNSVPDSYYAQVQHYMAVLDLKMAVVAVMIGLDFEIRYVPRNDKFIADMIEAERVVWFDYVQKRLLPDATGVEKEDKLLNKVYANPSVEIIDLSEFREKAARHLYLGTEIKAMDEERKELTAFFKSKLANAKKGLVPGFNVNWSRFKAKSFDQGKFEAENPEIAARYTSQIDTGRFTITAVKEKKAK